VSLAQFSSNDNVTAEVEMKIEAKKVTNEIS
jgi:hypothetical protein